MNCKYRKERNYINNKLPELERKLKEFGYTKENIKLLKSNKANKLDQEILDEHYDTINEYVKWNNLILHKRDKAKKSKKMLLKLLSNKVKQNEITDGKNHIRYIRESELQDNNVISVFESFLTRTIGIKKDEFTDALIVVQVYYFDVFKDISFFGFKYKNEKYKYFTSSAGQIRKKKAVFIKESVWNNIEKTIMCGLTIDRINSKGGNNVNKHLAYMALANSATDEWKEFNIDKSIVIDDFETNVHGEIDFVDETNYTIKRMDDDVPIPHTDGAGMILPFLCNKNFMFRSPWIKGLLVNII